MAINVRMLITVLFLTGLASLPAQNQRLTWVGDEYAMRYEVIIEQEAEGAYISVLREFTEESFIEVSLPAGKYRCQVIPYDFLNQPVPVTEWMNFEVRSSYHEIITVSEIPPTAPEPEKITEYKNQFDRYLGAAWVLRASVSPFGAAARFGIVSAQRRFFNPGMELTVSWLTDADDSGENVPLMLFDCAMIQQSRFTDDKIALNLRLGAGISLAYNGDSRWAVGQYSTHFNIGASLLCLIINNLFLEIGVEYSQLFTRDFDCFFRSSIGLSYRF